MAQIFKPSDDTWLRFALLLLVAAVVGAFLVAGGIVRSTYVTQVNQAPRQPVPFSHAHHVGGLGIDCQYCHTGFERSESAGLPPTHTCMSCHSQIWTDAPVLHPVRQSLLENRPIFWNRVADLPDHVYFNHEVHVSAGVGCVTCHGQMDEMHRTRQAEPFLMQWCLDCHRDPAPELRPASAITEVDWQVGVDRAAMGQELIEAHGIAVETLDDCYICHR
jgi:hypothetical protein